MKFSRYLRIALAIWLASPLAAGAQALIQVPSQATLQQAIDNVFDGGTIEIAAGTYVAPAGGFQAVNQTKRYTIRAAAGAAVTLSGANSTNILKLTSGNIANTRLVTFERLTFSGGRSSNSGTAGGLTIVQAQAEFVGCTFNGNISTSATGGGGGAMLANGAAITFVGTTFANNGARVSGSGGAIGANASTLFFIDAEFSDNDAWQAGGALNVGGSSRVYIHNSRFLRNRVNLPNHFVDSLGGAICVSDSKVTLTNTRMEANEAGFAGGAIYALGHWTNPVTTPSSEVMATNSTFVDNVTRRDASVPVTTAVAAGAVQIEDQVTFKSFNSRFVHNSAEAGGAIANYRGIAEIYHSVFQGNFVTGAAPGKSFGGAVVAVSDDQDAGDSINRRPATLIVRDSLFQGRFGSVTTAGRFGGCIMAAGDTNRAYGANGIPQMGSIASNRAVVDIVGGVFSDCDVQENQGGGIGGGVLLQLTDAVLTDSLFIGCDALAGATNTGSGGGLAEFDNSTASLLRTTIAKSTAGLNGAAIWAEGANLAVNDSRIVENRLVGPSIWGGAAIWTGFENIGAPRPPVNATGLIQASILSNNTGGAVILDYDSTSAPFNLMQYAGNSIFPNDANAYSNPIAASTHTISQLNSLSLHAISKAPSANQAPASAPIVGAIRAVPPATLPINASGDPAPPTSAYVAFAWSGGAATLNGGAVSGNMGISAQTPNAYTLSVSGSPFGTTLFNGNAPVGTLTASPTTVPSGSTATLNWATPVGAFLDEFIDQRVSLPASPASPGSATTPALFATTKFRSLLVAQQGGYVSSRDVVLASDHIFDNGFE